MHIITHPDLSETVRLPEIRQLIQIRWLQSELNAADGVAISSIIVVEANDSVHLVEQAICDCLRKIPTADNQPLDEVFTPSFDWIVTHPTCYELAFVHCDREEGVCVLIEKARNVDLDLLALGDAYGLPVPEVIELEVQAI